MSSLPPTKLPPSVILRTKKIEKSPIRISFPKFLPGDFSFVQLSATSSPLSTWLPLQFLLLARQRKSAKNQHFNLSVTPFYLRALFTGG
ncbi:hypothetical protein JTE90_003186 [Oedothorax gibbosus]|uniref:Uncharacterized protein n=1 Tax=Oedothorax gibbosus TaxID=931172 RepID=A0AAV6UPI9_9ARAC|nr:hypothetical protein JTE90_003186 [Oedothorax gibbosus]